MQDLPWWGWVIAALALVVIFLSTALGTFRRQVRRQFLELLRSEHPDLEIIQLRSRGVKFRSEAIGKGEFFFARLYTAIAELGDDDDEAREPVYRAFLATLNEGIEWTLNLETHGNQLLPRIMESVRFEGVPDDKQPLSRPLDKTDLCVAFVLDSDQSVRYLTPRNLKDLGVTLDDLHERALSNLRNRSSLQALRAALDEGELMMINKSDSYDAARLLLVPECLADGESLAAVIPDRDTLALLPVPHDDDWSAIRNMARTPASNRLICHDPLLVTRDGIVRMTR